MKDSRCDHPEPENPGEESSASLRKQLERNEMEMKALANANASFALLMHALQLLADAEKGLHIDNDITAFYKKLTKGAMTVMGACYGAFGLFNPDGELDEFITAGMSEEQIQGIGAPPRGEGLLGALYREHSLVRVDDIAQDDRSCGFPQGHPKMTSLMGMPFVINGVSRGVLYLADKCSGEPFTASDEQFLEIYARDASYLLERHELFDALHSGNAALRKEKEEQQLLLDKLQEAQEQLLQSEKLAAIGQLAAGVAHEINNPIGYISSNMRTLEGYIDNLISVIRVYEGAEGALQEKTELLQSIRSVKEKVDLEYTKGDCVSLLHESQEGIERVKKIVQDLKDFSRTGETAWQWTDIHLGLDSTLNIVNNEIKYKAEVIKEYGALPEVECVPSQLNQVFMNMLVNAAHAIEERGAITIRTSQMDEEWISIEISDTGKGIEKAHLPKLFDPFFTTKPVGKGTGLGLSLAHGIVTKHGGRIEVESEPGKGTTFRVVIPVKHTDPDAVDAA